MNNGFNEISCMEDKEKLESDKTCIDGEFESDLNPSDDPGFDDGTTVCNDVGFVDHNESDVFNNGEGDRNVEINQDLTSLVIEKGLSRIVDFGNLDCRISCDMFESVDKAKAKFPNFNLDYVGSLQAKGGYAENGVSLVCDERYCCDPEKDCSLGYIYVDRDELKAYFDCLLGYYIADQVNAENDDQMQVIYYNPENPRGYRGSGRGDTEGVKLFIASEWVNFKNNPDCDCYARKVVERLVELYKSWVPEKKLVRKK